MRPPTLTWIAFNVFRLLAIVAMVWALAAQFLCIASDMMAYHSAKNSSSSPVQDTQTGSAKTSMPVSWPSATLASDSASKADTSMTVPTSTEVAVFRPTGSFDTDGDGSSDNAVKGAVLRKRDTNTSGNTIEADFGLSSIPRQPGGIVQVPLPHVSPGRADWIALQLGIAIAPHTGCLALPAHSGASWLAGNVSVCACCMARPAKYAHLDGCPAVNGGGLIIQYRRMPRSPPPALYFNLSQRLLYFTPLPECYLQLFQKSSPDPGNDTPVPPSNAQEIGLDEEEKIEGPPSLPQHLPELDIRRGGYPTFSGGSVADPTSQVPKGVVETDKRGMPIRFAREDGQGAGKLRRQNRRPVERESPLSPREASLARSKPPPLTKKASPPKPSEKPDYRQSPMAAATDLGPHFPLPPGRPASTLACAKQARRESIATSAGSTRGPAVLSTGPKSPNPARIRSDAGDKRISVSQSVTPTKLTLPPKRRQTVAVSVGHGSKSSTDADAKSTTNKSQTVKSKGVRFDLSPISSPDTVRDSIASPPRSGFRIPGIGLIPLPFSAPSTPIARPESDLIVRESHLELDGDSARPESFASVSTTGSSDTFQSEPVEITGLSEDKAALPRSRLRGGSGSTISVSRPKSEAVVLGGKYLDDAWWEVSR
ncbi:hypothetical protein P7C73_g3970, partial [Tremellales sp. Uapishka_1]